MSHDQNFKNLILDFPREALDFFAPGAVDGLDSAIITAMRDEQLKEWLGGHYRILDVALKLEWPDSGREPLLVDIEVESDPRRFSLRRLAHYCIDLTGGSRIDRIMPLVVFLRTGKYPERLDLGGPNAAADTMGFRFWVGDLGRMPVGDHWDSGNIVARVNLPNMDPGARRRVDVYAQAVAALPALVEDLGKQDKYLDFIDIYADLSENERKQFQQDYPEEDTEMRTISARRHEEGFKQGNANMLMHLVARKFGADNAEAERARIEEADPETLLAWSERVLDAGSIEDVFE